MDKVQVYPDPNSLAQAAAALFVALAREAIADHGRFAVMLSGGNTPRAIHDRLSGGELTSQIDWQHVHLFWGDERCVPPDSPDSNYRMARETLLERVPVPAANIHRIRGEDEPEAAAAAYERELRGFCTGGTNLPAPCFDLVLLGLGDDGHTASLFPHSSALHENEHWVVAVPHSTGPAPHVSRVTITPPVINAAGFVVFLVTGANKAQRLQQVLSQGADPDQLPAQVVQPLRGQLAWLVDTAAAGRLADSKAP